MIVHKQTSSGQLIKIAITGPESTGKSELSMKLAKHYQTVFVPEYARIYIDNLDRPYNCEDILEIAKGQIEMEQKLEREASGFLFTDTELTVTRIWSLHKCGYCHPWIEEQIAVHKYDLILLCDVDLPWEFDPQREHPHLRKFFFDWYYNELSQRDENFEVVSGIGDNRLNNAIGIIEKRFHF